MASTTSHLFLHHQTPSPFRITPPSNHFFLRLNQRPPLRTTHWAAISFLSPIKPMISASNHLSLSTNTPLFRRLITHPSLRTLSIASDASGRGDDQDSPKFESLMDQEGNDGEHVEKKSGFLWPFTKGLAITIVFTVAFCLRRINGAFPLLMYIGSLCARIGAYGIHVGSSAPIYLNKQVTPLRGCYDVKQELEEVSNLDKQGRQEILKLNLEGKPLAEDIDVKSIARCTLGFNGADLANLVNIAAIKAVMDGAEKLTNAHLELAKDKIIMGSERKNLFVSDESKKLSAYYVSGHTIVAFNTDGADPIHRITILPCGSTLGMLTQLPSIDETSVSKKQLLARLDVFIAGRVAEELIFGQDHVTTRGSSDLKSATELTKYMVSSGGMSDVIELIITGQPSSAMQSRIDAEVVKLLRNSYKRVRVLLKKHEKTLHLLANKLLEYETLSAEDMKHIVSNYL